MNKYVQMLRKQALTQLEQWRQAQGPISEAALYRFLHSMKGTAGTIGLQEWTEAAQRLLEHVEEEGTRSWNAEDTMRFLQPLASLVEAGHREEDVAAAGAALRRSKASDDDGLVILLDDDTELLSVMKETLERQGLHVMATPKPERALEWFYSMQPDCIIMDIVLPGGRNGIELLRAIQFDCERSFVASVLVSGKDDKTTRLASYGIGADDFIAKPFDLEEFAARVQKLIRRRKKLVRIVRAHGSAEAPPGEEDERAASGNLRIAIVDDEPLIRSMLTKRLNDLDIHEELEVRSFEDGEQYFEDEWYGKDGRFLLIVDRMMPRMNGIELVSRIRSDFGTKRHTILMLTGVDEEQSVSHALRAGADDYMTKPFSLTELEARVRKLIRGFRT